MLGGSSRTAKAAIQALANPLHLSMHANGTSSSKVSSSGQATAYSCLMTATRPSKAGVKLASLSAEAMQYAMGRKLLVQVWMSTTLKPIGM